jgi:hypothetical protein
MTFSQAYAALNGYGATDPIHVRLDNDPKLRYLADVATHRAKIQVIIASNGDGPYQTTGAFPGAKRGTGYILQSITKRHRQGPIFKMTTVELTPGQITSINPTSN